MSKIKIAFYTIGCKLNYAETSTISRQFSNLIYQHVGHEDVADIYVINNCSVTKNAENEFHYIIRTLMHKNEKAFVIAIGCYTQLNPKAISYIKGVDLVLGYEAKCNITNYISFPLSKRYPATIISRKTYPLSKIYPYTIISRKTYTFFSSYSIGERTRSFLKIQDGCDYRCSYCIIPITRGPSRSDSLDNILNKIKYIFNKGVKEIVLTGVNIGDYGKKIYGNYNRRSYTFFDLIQAIDEIKEKGRIRLSSIEPNLLKTECIEFLSKSNHFVPHFHIPLQSGSNYILGKMQRRYNIELYKDKIKYILHCDPDAYIGSDVIVGFPGETHQHFLETYWFLEKLNISSLHVFSYSNRPKTKSINFHNDLSKKRKSQRNKILRHLSKTKYISFCERQINKKKVVLVENNHFKRKYLYGYTENYIRTKILYNPIFQNTFQKVILMKIDPKDGMMIATSIA
ncbi:tRNA (N(6)-L-threonylcarbamoyladenosine(37)-C(2))-methylthiotransferase MtaB [Blattabacterium cuenoti]|uniref:tRNA (N(6)-L-threonylcarbamoyladenosine(37)-C(2))- methylthiotransferase MtaB n=1 Tax=Blattabacterium cuenoti TaxID=1653831 RepID=UPI00163C976D|nr:tRNA (N(6)-L-threonylcarbamoyladenosine(37)-C(2))-methylthiotransferase MtaB [Blattabacterium cuenoti]